MKDQDNVCRVCSAQDNILLDLFGPQPQSRSYAADVTKCLSVEVSEGDGLPGKICIKCVGLLSDCRPFVEKVLELTGDGKERSVSVEECFFCLSSENCLFPIPALSVSKTKYCFGIDVLATRQICHKCQFHLESIHELKEKAIAALKTHCKESMSPKRGRKPSSMKAKPRAKKTVSEDGDSISQSNCEKRESVNDMVNKLRQTYKMGEDESKSVKVRIVDIKLIIGPDFLSKGTINVTEFYQKLNPSSTPIVDVVSRRGRKKSNLLTAKESTLKSPVSIPKPDSLSKSLLPTSQKLVQTRKRSRESETDIECPSKKSHSEKDEDNSPINEADSIVDESLTDEGKKNQKRRKRGLSSDSLLKCSDAESEKEELRISREDGESVNKGDENDGLEEERTESHDNAVPSNRLNGEKEDVTDPGQIDESLDESKENEGQSKLKRKKRKGNSTNFSKYFDDEDKPQPIIRRKRKDSEDEFNGSSPFKGFKGRKRRWEPSHEDQGVDEPSTSDSVENVEQPEFLKELDELLKFTPKAKFKPFICSVCHEGYVSTVKGKLHKLIVHDPHSKQMSLTLHRCDDSPEMEAWKDRIERERLEKQSLPQEITCDGSDKESVGYIIDDDDVVEKEEEQINNENKSSENKELREDRKSKEDFKSKENGLDSDDELFESQVKPPIETTNAFEELLKSSSINERKDQETLNSSASEKVAEEANSPPKHLAGKDVQDMGKDEKESEDNLPNDDSNRGDETTDISLECKKDLPEGMSQAEKNCDPPEGEVENEADVKTDDAEEKTHGNEEKTYDKEEKTSDKEEKTSDVEEDTFDKEEKTCDNEEKTANVDEKTNDADEKIDVRVEGPSVEAESQEEGSTNGVADQEEKRNSETEEQGADKRAKEDVEVIETNKKPLENEMQESNDVNESISDENQVEGVKLLTGRTEDVSVDVDGLPTGNVNESQGTLESDEDRHADVESNGDSGEGIEVKGCSEEPLESEVQPDLCDNAHSAQEPNANAAGITVSN